MKIKLKTIQSSLFSTYSLIIIIVLAIFVVYFYMWGSSVLKEKAYESIDRLTTTFMEKLDSEIQKMDTISVNICYSNLVRDKFQKYLTDSNPEEYSVGSKESQDTLQNQKDLEEMLLAINGPSIPVQQINLYNFNGQMLGTGFDNRQQSIYVKAKDWYPDVMKKAGSKYLTEPTQDPALSRSMFRNTNSYYISLCRIYYDRYNVQQGIVEVTKFYENIFNSIIQYSQKKSPSEKIFVFNNTGKRIFPIITVPGAGADYYKHIGDKPAGSPYLNITNAETGGREMLIYKQSAYTGWTVMMISSEKELLAPIYTFTRVVFFFAVAILLLALLISFIAARKYTNPIAKLRMIIRSMDLQEPAASNPQDLNSGLSELEELNQAFYKMNVKVKKSVDDLLLSQQHEMQSKMLALQSQMNPHFLYNTLTTISVMAEEGMDEQIAEMCGHVSDMLRYISSDSSQLVKMNTEIEYTEKYLACMKIRYGAKLSYSIDIGSDLREVPIPKLVIQPLVENALKYGIYKEPPWHVRISGFAGNNYWQLNVQDNGPGFAEKQLERIRRKIEEINRSGLLPSLELEGMGLLNIYIRLKLIYGSQMIFSIAENPEGGAILTIGGYLKP